MGLNKEEHPAVSGAKMKDRTPDVKPRGKRLIGMTKLIKDGTRFRNDNPKQIGGLN